MGKKKDFNQKEPGQNYEKLIEAQRHKTRYKINSIQKSKDRDQEELKQLADEGLNRRRQQRMPRIVPQDKLET